MDIKEAVEVKIKGYDSETITPLNYFEIVKKADRILLNLAQSYLSITGMPKEEDYLDRFSEVVKGLKIDKNIAEKLANFIHYEIRTAKIQATKDCFKRIDEGKIAEIKKYCDVLRNNEDLSYGGLRTIKIIEDKIEALSKAIEKGKVLRVVE